MLIFYKEESNLANIKPLQKAKVKATCCDKYKNKKRCKDCPCFDLHE